MNSKLNNIQLSLSDLLGVDYMKSVCKTKAFLTGESIMDLQKIADNKVSFYPDKFAAHQDTLVDSIGRQVIDVDIKTAYGAGTSAFQDACKNDMAPLGGSGFIRVGENGKAYLISKSEHYHASVGHHFPGYQLIEYAKKCGICNVTHNNTRGHITRLVEEELVRVANGIKPKDRSSLSSLINKEENHLLNRVINLETGSLAVEAALKMIMARFYKLEDSFSEPEYSGKIPVILVMADNEGGKKANYHGTTVLTQCMRGMWPEFSNKLEQNKLFIVKSVRINDLNHFKELVNQYDKGEYKIAGFFHELILMNYGGIRIEEKFIKNAHKLCDEKDIPTVIDEIQSCMWSPELFMFKEYGLTPDFVSIGKGFPGGQYPASKILTTAKMDNLNQFGALVTNGQEELASLTYLITIAFAEGNSDYTREIGSYYENRVREIAKNYSKVIDRVEGQAHLTTIYFHAAEKAIEFCKKLTDRGIDISAHTYKAKCPPSALTKIPLISSEKMVNFLANSMDDVLKGMA
jgi:acetylornithine/succinyldiaminopimelate/putrescine aminotransferase